MNDLKIDLLTSKLVAPREKTIRNIWINMWGIETIDIKRLKFMADLFYNYPKASRLIINASDNVKEELEVFRRVHNVRFMEK